MTPVAPAPRAAVTARQSRLPRLGFVGGGWIGRHRLAALTTSGAASVVRIADPCREAAEAAEAMFHNADGPSSAWAREGHLSGGGCLIEVEDYATATIRLETGATVSFACAWDVALGRDCMIRVALHGTHGGAALENMGGSFHDFRAERYHHTRTELLCAPPDVWGGRAAVAWAYRLATDRRFDPEAGRFVEVANVLDRVYAS